MHLLANIPTNHDVKIPEAIKHRHDDTTFSPATTMFKKPPAHLSNSTPLRQSDRRKVLAAILELYPEIARDLDEAEAKNVAKVLVPEGLRSGGMETNSGVEGVCPCVGFPFVD
jgi:hypothetical protein